ncbi:MAG: S-layer homology domain-containing protein [Actinomycetota bacterium]
MTLSERGAPRRSLRVRAVVAIGLMVAAAALLSLPAHADDSPLSRFANAPGLAPTDADFDPVSGHVIAGVSALSGIRANQIIGFDPADGEVVWALNQASEPQQIAVSDDGTRAYAARADGTVVEIDLSTRTAVRTFELIAGDDTVLVTDLDVRPTDASTIVVAVDVLGSDPSEPSFVATYTDGARNTDLVDSANPAVYVVFTDADTAVGVSQFGPRMLYRYAIDGDGISLEASANAADAAAVRLAASGGIVYTVPWAIDPATLTPTLTAASWSQGVRPSLDVLDGYVYVPDGLGSVLALDITDFSVVGDPLVPVDTDDLRRGILATPHGLIAWGPSGFAADESTVVTTTSTTTTTILDDQMTINGDVRLDLEGTGFTYTGPPLEFCVDVWDASDETLLASVETFEGGLYEVTYDPVPVKVLFWDCNGNGVFASWFNDRVLFDWDGATTVQPNADRSFEIMARLDPWFVDLTPGAFYVDPVLFLRDTGITTGCGPLIYCPGNDVTREQMAAFMARFWRLLDGDCSGEPSVFVDVAPTSFAYFDVGCIADLGVTTGTSATTYSPGNVVTREQMASFVARLYRAFGLECPDGGHPFTDVSATSFANADIACIFNLGITNGTSATTYGPAQPVTRAQMAAFLERLYDAVTA